MSLKVDQFASGHAPQPIMVDKTPPIVGVVSDGDRLQGDLQYQHETDKICAQWTNFFDPESGIRKYILQSIRFCFSLLIYDSITMMISYGL